MLEGNGVTFLTLKNGTRPHDIALNETEEMQQQISQLWDVVVELRKDVDRRNSAFRFGERMSDTRSMRIITEAGEKKDDK